MADERSVWLSPAPRLLLLPAGHDNLFLFGVEADTINRLREVRCAALWEGSTAAPSWGLLTAFPLCATMHHSL